MADVKSYLSQNIKSLRTAFGESQMDLAFAIGLDAPTSISNYESGTRSPKPEVRKKIAEHYRITEEQLMHVDLSGMRQISFKAIFGDIHKIHELGSAVFPVVCSEEAMTNKVFAAGYYAHMRIRKCMLAGQEPDDKDYDICFDSYLSAFNEDAVPEAAGNILWWLLQLELIVLNQKKKEWPQHLIDNKKTGAEFLQQCYLRNFDFEKEDGTDDESNKEIMNSYNEIEEIVQNLLKKLQSSRLSDLAYFYTAIRYVCGIVKNELSQDMNQAVGAQMLWAFSELGNKYAKSYLQAIIRISYI